MPPKIINPLVFLILGFLSLAIVANSMTKPLGHDEQMYCAGGALLAQGKMIYKDFSYVAQMPYHPLFCAALFKVLNTTHYLLTARILSTVCDIVITVCIVIIYRRVFNSFPITGLFLGLGAAFLYVFNPFVDYANGFAWNHDLVILCVVLSLWIFQTTDFERQSQYWRTALIGSLLTLATCMRITTALVQVLVFIVLLFQPAQSGKQRLKRVATFSIATAIGLIWPIWVVVLAPRAFFLNLFWIPKLNSQWLHLTGMLYTKPGMTMTFLTTPASFLLILTTIYLCVILIRNRDKLTLSDKMPVLLPAMLVVVFFIIAFIPPTMWVQYFAAPIPFLIISFAYPLLYLRKLTNDKPFIIAAVLMAACAVVSVISYPIVLQRVPRLLYPQSWTPIKVHHISEDIAEKTKSPKPVLTLSPLFALEGGRNIYTELSAGPFVYRVADLLSPADRKIANTVGSETLQQLLENCPPSALIVGFEPRFLEITLFKTAGLKEDTWGEKTYHNGLVLYFRR